jgi:CBS domain-containing protein
MKDYLFSREIGPYIIPKEKVVVVDPDWSLHRALLVLTRKSTSSVPVINQEGQVEGLISKTNILDFLFAISKDQEIDFSELKHYPVKEAMDRNHGGILANSIFSFAFEVLIHRPYVPIIDIKNRFLGILTRKVMMEKVIEYFQQEYMQTMLEHKT